MISLQGKWQQMAVYYTEHPTQFTKLLDQVSSFISRDGLRSVSKELGDLYGYAKDIATGNYKCYNITSLLVVVAAFAYLVTPSDFLPDFYPAVGLVDDASVIAFVAKEMVEELTRYKVLKPLLGGPKKSESTDLVEDNKPA